MNEISYSNFLVGGLASVGATTVTNPIEVIKTRLQLQGELVREGKYQKNYGGVLHAFVQVAKHDGIYGLQKGLLPNVGFQFVLNAIRLGIFETATVAGLTKASNGSESVLKSFFWGAFGGVLGSCAGSPFFLVKTQMQSYSTSSIAVGYQRHHAGMMHAFRKIYAAGGFRGLYRGVIGNIPRAIFGSGSQLAAFGPTKDFLRRHDLSFKSSAANSFVCGLTAGSVMAICMTPPDMILTRLYNQPLDENGKGRLYKGVFDCFFKVRREEGFKGLYKGFWPNYLRIAPHSTLVLLFFDEMKLAKKKYGL